MKKKLLQKKIAVPTLIIILSLIGYQNFYESEIQTISIDKQREKFNTFLDEHPFNNRNISKEDYKGIPKQDRPDLAAEQDYLMMVDPNSLTVPYDEVLSAFQITSRKLKQRKLLKNAILKNKKSIKSNSKDFFEVNDGTINFQEALTVGGNPVIWKERGPDNVGGRTRAILWDPNDPTNRRVFAAGVSGGIWVNDNVLDPNSSWRAVNDFLASIAVNTLVADPNNPQIFYAGTGEGWFNGGAVEGIGIFKSTDGGKTWNLLPGATGLTFAYVQKIEMTPTGTIIAATRAVNSQDGGIFRSTDNGTSFTRVLNTRGADVEVAANGDIYASRGIFSTGTIFKSSDDGVTWSDVTPPGGNNPARIEIATAPSNANIVYAIAQDRNDNTIDWMQKSSDAGATWVNLPVPQHNDQCVAEATDITRGQAWFDLILAVSPTNPDVVIAGGVDLARTDDGGQTWTQISEWANCSDLQDVHADQHAIEFRPGFPNEALFGNDGGIYYSTNIGLASKPTFETRDKNYTTSQFYAVATDNVNGSDYYIGGSQDNGTQQLRSDLGFASVQIWGGDGGFSHIDQLDRTYQLVSSQGGNVAHSSNGGTSFRNVSSLGDGNFINQSDYDNTAGILYSAADKDQIGKITDVKTNNPSSEVAISVNIGGRQASAIRANTNTANTIFVGTEGGGIYKIDNAHLEAPTVTNITNNITAVGNVSSIDIGSSDMELIATISNFNVSSVWYSSDGGTTWVNKDDTGHGLPNIPIRWALFNPNNTKQVLLATELGVWSTNDITATNPGWEPSNEGLANVRCDMIQYREADQMIVVATHGRGFFTSNIFAADDTTAPTVTSLNPADDITTVSPLDVNLEMQFNEPIKVGSGNVKIYLASNNSLVESISASSDQVNVSGSRVIINPSADFNALTGYYVQVDAGAFTDNFGNNFAGITDTTTWNFSTFDGDVPPVVNIPVSDLSVDENSVNQIIDLSNVFNDTDNDNNLITYAIFSNSNSSTVGTSLTGSNLTLSILANKIGIAEIVVRATSNGKTVDETFNVTVNSLATTLFDQPGPNARTGLSEGTYNNGANRNVEDFIIPGGQSWNISTVTTQAFSLGEANLNLQNVNVVIYNDNAGAPGTLLEQQTILANQGQIIGGSLENTSLTVRLNSVINLTSGTYWVSIHPTFGVNFGQDSNTSLYAWYRSAADGNSHSEDTPGVFTPDNRELLFTIDGTAIITDATPTVANPIADIELTEIPTPNPMVIDLSSTFTDTDNDDNLITIEVIGNTNTAIVTPSISGKELSLNFIGFGTSEITIKATSNGLTVEDSFTVSILSPLYSQTGTEAGRTASQVFPDFNDETIESADNFTIPSGKTWDLLSVDVQGSASNNSPQLALFNIYEDDNGLPGTEVFSSGNLTLEPTTDLSNFRLTLNSPTTLSSGTYWISVRTYQAFNPGGNQWLWAYYTPSVNGDYVRQSPTGVAGVETSWTAGGNDGALIFSLFGESKDVLSTADFDKNELRILANPTNGLFEVKLGTTFSSDLKVHVYDLRGRMVKKQSVSFNQLDFTIDLRNEASGIYMMRISSSNKSKSFKIIKE